MPALTNPLPQPAPGGQPAPARPPLGPILVKLFTALGVIVVLGAAGYFYWTSRAREAERAASLASTKTVTVERGPIETRIRLTGQTSARNYAVVTAPRQQGREANQPMVLLSIIPSGKFVKKGDIVAEVDPQSIKDHLDDTLDGLRDKENDIKKLVVNQKLDMENLDQNLRVAKAALDKAILDQKTTPIRTEIDMELLRLSVEEAQATYNELKTDVPQKVISQKASMRISEISKSMEDQHVARHQGDLARFVIRAPMDGMAVVQTFNRPGGDQVMIAVGDRIGPGQPLMKILDPKTMQVEGQVYQSESSAFRIGQEASVSLDAFPGSKYGAKVYAIGALAVSGGRQQFYIRTIPVRVQMTNPDAKVIPDLSAAADVLLARTESVLQVPLSALESSAGKSYVSVKAGNRFERRAVETGVNNGLVVEIKSGLKEGDTVRLN